MEKHMRISWIDVAKGICMICVIAGHMGVASINRIVFSFHLTVFFILSGYTLKNNFSLTALTKRFRSLMVPYFVTCLAVACMDIINLFLLRADTSISAITQKISYNLARSFMASGTITTFGSVDIGGHIGAIWFLPATFFAVSIAQALLKYVPTCRNRYFISCAGAACACIIAQFLWLPFSFLSALVAVPLVLLGYDMKERDLIKQLSLPRVLLCLVIFVVGIIFKKTPIYYVTSYMADYLLSPICALASSACVIYLSQKLEKSKVLAWIGRNSIYYLCVHLFEMNTMGTWYRRFLQWAGLPESKALLFLIRFILITAIVLIISLWRQRPKKEAANTSTPSRDSALDVAKAGLIILMIVGHFRVDAELRKIIYSFHMAAFVFYSGYCFRPESAKNLVSSIGKQIKSFLIPYALFGTAYILLTHNGFWVELKTLLFGISFSKNLLTDVQSIGPVYFILLLFLVKVLYLFIERLCPREPLKSVVVLALSLLGVYLGKKGWWLPWSADCALYALSLYHIGHYFKKYAVMEYLCRRNFSYFILSSVWAYMIHAGSMELAVRNYGSYGLTLMGAVSASVLLYMCCRYLCLIWNRRIVSVICCIEKNTLYILFVHKLLSGYIGKAVTLLFSSGSVFYIALTIILQILLGVLIGSIFAYIRRLFAKAAASVPVVSGN